MITFGNNKGSESTGQWCYRLHREDLVYILGVAASRQVAAHSMAVSLKHIGHSCISLTEAIISMKMV